jgi:uncharacterized circularly permuted ATP-grasp superfamily protein/uncharacterized alpha-E superfamily protein
MIQDPSPSAAGILDRYAASPGVFDEMVLPDQDVRPHWVKTVSALQKLGTDELVRSVQESRRILRENGVTYNIYNEPQGFGRTWSFDPIPFVMAEQEFRALSSALEERANVWDLILRDLYGPRDLIRTGVIPPEIIDEDPRYLRPCRGLLQVGRRFLNTYAADVARQPSGEFIVLEDRTQAPSGSGYALENRIVQARLFPDLYRETHVHRLAVFFRAAISSLMATAADNTGEPRIVLLTPGPGNETYFEHSYLAHYLGITLVEGSDLLVSDRKVWLRSLGGQERVHAIVRRVDDSFCDPLELRSDSVLGVPGLLSAIRAGSVVVTNTPGTGIAESPALAAYLPFIANKLLGKDLSLPTARSWWCGIPDHENYVLEHLDQLLIRSTKTESREKLRFPGRMTKEERIRLVQQIRQSPSDFAARELVSLSTTPVMIDGRLEPREMVLRTFLFGSPNGYEVMQGGLTRVAPVRGQGRISSQDGGISKDTWVLSESKPVFVTMLPGGGAQPEIVRTVGDDMVSRVAENLFWLGRYAERTEGTARLLRSAVRRILDARRADNVVCPPDLLRTVTQLTTTFPGFLGSDELLEHPDDELISLVMDSQRPGSLAFSIKGLRRTAQSARDRVSDDMWRIVHTLGDGLTSSRHLGEIIDPLAEVILGLSAVAGLVSDSMTRGPAFWFLDFGRRVERAIDTTTLLRSGLFHSAEFLDPMAEAVLEVTDSVMTYRRRYKGRLHPAGVLDLLLTDPHNPRSVVYQLLRMRELLASFPSRNEPQTLDGVKQMLTLSQGTIAMTDTDTLERAHDDGTVIPSIGRSLATLEASLRGISDAICRYYFAPRPAPRFLVEYQ